MAASSGSSAQAIADALLIDAGTSVAFGSVPGAVSGAMDVGTTPDGRLWFRAVLAVQFARVPVHVRRRILVRRRIHVPGH